MLHSASLQNLTEWRRDSPFFGSVPRCSVLDGGAIVRIGDQKLEIVSWGKVGNIVIVDLWR